MIHSGSNIGQTFYQKKEIKSNYMQNQIFKNHSKLIIYKKKKQKEIN